MPARRREPLARETDKNLRAGMTPEEARRRASIAFGSVSEFKEGVRDADDLVPWFGAFDTEATAPLRGSRRQRHRRRSRLTWNC